MNLYGKWLFECTSGKDIVWQRVPVTKMKQSEFTDFLIRLDAEHEGCRILGNQGYTKSFLWHNWSWKFEVRKTFYDIYLCLDCRLYHFVLNKVDPNRGNNFTGSQAFKEVMRRFNEQPDVQKNLLKGPRGGIRFVSSFVSTRKDANGEDKDVDVVSTHPFKSAFGCSPYNTRDCVPKQFSYYNPSYAGVITRASYADFCSQYPTNARGLLPYWSDETNKVVRGRALPNKDYPFAYYPDTHNYAEFDPKTGKITVDTHDWRYSKFCDYLYREDDLGRSIPFMEDTKTILCIPSKFHLDDIMESIYAERKIPGKDKFMKFTMNAFIGCMRMNDERMYAGKPFAHIAATIVARSNERTRHLAEDIIGFDNVLHLVVDGVQYLQPVKYGVEEKKLGNLHQEVFNRPYMLMQANCWAFQMEDGSYVYKHGAFDMRKDGADINEKFDGFYDMYDQWTVSKRDKVIDKYVRLFNIECRGEIYEEC